MVSGLTTSVNAAAIATLARKGIARIAAMTVWKNGMITPIPSPSATARGTERWVMCHNAGWPSCRAKGLSSRLC